MLLINESRSTMYRALSMQTAAGQERNFIEEFGYRSDRSNTMKVNLLSKVGGFELLSIHPADSKYFRALLCIA